MARSEDDRSADSSFDAGSPPADAPAAIPGTEPHTTPALTSQDRRTVEAGPATGSPAPGSPAHDVVYDDRRQRAVDPHQDPPPANEGHPLKDAADKVRQAVEPRPSPTGTMGGSGEHARLPERD